MIRIDWRGYSRCGLNVEVLRLPKVRTQHPIRSAFHCVYVRFSEKLWACLCGRVVVSFHGDWTFHLTVIESSVKAGKGWTADSESHFGMVCAEAS